MDITNNEVNEFLKVELDSELIVYLSKDYVKHVVAKSIEINNKNQIDIDKLLKIIEDYIDKNPRSKTVLNNLKKIIENERNRGM